MEWKLSATKKVEYDKLVKAAQESEAAIGAAQYRVTKIIGMRAAVDVDIKKWWDSVSEELKFDKGKDYMLGADGTIKEVPRQPQQPAMPAQGDVSEAKPSMVGTNAAELR